LSRLSKDHSARSISIGPAIAAGTTFENAGRTPANNGGGAGAGDEFAYVPETGPGFEYPPQVAWDVTFTGGTFTALVVNLEASDDGVNWFQLDTNNAVTAAGYRRVVSNTLARLLRLNITTFTSASGTPIVTGGITA
jgi:hypothetical protein